MPVKTPPFLLLAALLFWGWQSGNLLVGTSLGLILESIRFIPVRWELAEEDFRRIWNFCTLLALAQIVLVFTLNDQSSSNTNNNFRTATATVHSATTLLRWLPATMAAMVAAQSLSQAGRVPVAAMLMSSRYRRLAAQRMINVSYPYFIIVLFSAGMHSNAEAQTFWEKNAYFFGFCALIAWALWPWRARRFGLLIWLVSLTLAMGLGNLGARGIGLLESYLEGYSSQLMVGLLRQTDPNKSHTSMGDIGRLKLSGKIIIRLQTTNSTPAPGYLHEATYWHYGSQTWSVDVFSNEFQTVSPDANNENNFTLVPGATNRSEVTISSYLDHWSKELNVAEGLLPLPSGTHHLAQLPVAALGRNQYGAVQADGPGLLIFQAQYGPGDTIDSAPNTNDFQVPANELHALTNVIAEMHADGPGDTKKMLTVAQFFSEKFSYSIYQGPDKIGRTNKETPLTRFLLFSRSGHCEYFATATVLLLRQLHIPARYAVGYAVHEVRGKGYVIRERDAHAWCLVWNRDKHIWEDFDTTPGTWIATESERASPFQWLSDFFSGLKYQIARFRYGQAQWRQYALWLIVPGLLFLLYRIFFRRGRQRGKIQSEGENKSATDWPGLDSEFYRLESRLAECGVPRLPAETLTDWLHRALADPALAELRQHIAELLLLHYRYRFDPEGLDPLTREDLRLRTTECLEALEPSNLQKKTYDPA